ncbi:MAG: hypothetical protein ACFFD4_21980 [Candidatus Odinarchaeota archaeon]
MKITSPEPVFGLLLLFDGIIAIVAGLFVFNRDRKYELNQLIAGTMVFFSLFFIFEGLIYILPLTLLNVFDLLRASSLVSAVIAATLAAIASLFVWKGKTFITQRKNLGLFSILGIIAVAAIAVDSRVIYDNVGDSISFENGLIGLTGAFVIPIFLIIITLIGFLQTLQTVEKTDPVYRRLLFLTVSLVLIIIGQVYYAVLEALDMREGIVGMGGHVFYTGASLLLMYAFSKRK